MFTHRIGTAFATKKSETKLSSIDSFAYSSMLV